MSTKLTLSANCAFGCDFAIGVTKSAPSFKSIRQAKLNGVKLDDIVCLESNDEVRIASFVRNMSDMNSQRRRG